MRKPFFALVCLSLFASFLLTSCSKDKKAEKVFYESGGEWNIDKITVGIIYNGVDLGTDTDEDAGTINFNKNGSGTFDYDYSLSYSYLFFTIPLRVDRNGNFAWSLSDNIISVPNGDGNVQEWTTSNSDANEQIWTSNYSGADTAGNTVVYDVVKEVSKK